MQRKGVTGALKTRENWKVWCLLPSAVPRLSLRHLEASSTPSGSTLPAGLPQDLIGLGLEGLTGACIRYQRSVGPRGGAV